MSHAEKLRQYLADKRATSNDDAARWTDDTGLHLLLTHEGPLSADALIDAHVRALAAGARLVVATTGEASPVARRTAARFGIEILDVASLPEPAAAPAPGAVPIETAWAGATAAFASGAGGSSPVPAAPAPPAAAPGFPLPAPGFFGALEREPVDLAPAAEAFAAFDALALATGEASPAVDVPLSPAPPIAAPTPDLAPPAAPPAPPEASPLLVAASEPAPVVAHEDPAMPWDLSLSTPEPEPVHVEAAELAAMPWNLHSEQHEMLPAGRAATFAPQRPTAMAHDWGLPWPRPVPPTGGLAIADPRIWHVQERVEQVREDLNKAGAPSFGAVKPEGSSWLKRLHEFP